MPVVLNSRECDSRKLVKWIVPCIAWLSHLGLLYHMSRRSKRDLGTIPIRYTAQLMDCSSMHFVWKLYLTFLQSGHSLDCVNPIKYSFCAFTVDHIHLILFLISTQGSQCSACSLASANKEHDFADGNIFMPDIQLKGGTDKLKPFDCTCAMIWSQQFS